MEKHPLTPQERRALLIRATPLLVRRAREQEYVERQFERRIKVIVGAHR